MTLLHLVHNCRVNESRSIAAHAVMGHLGAKLLSFAAPLAVPTALAGSVLLGIPISLALSVAAVGVGALFCAALATADADLRLLSRGNHAKTAFEGKVVVIVGASSGIGAALALYLARQRAVLVLSSRGQEQLQVRDVLLQHSYQLFRVFCHVRYDLSPVFAVGRMHICMVCSEAMERIQMSRCSATCSVLL